MRIFTTCRKAMGLVSLAIMASLVSHPARADTPTFGNVTDADFGAIVKDLSANFAYSTTTPASSLGGLWGFEFGLVGGLTKTPQILDLVKKTSPSYDQKYFPHAGALIRIGAPLGLTAEALILPKINASQGHLSQYGGSVMWTVTDVYWKQLPFNLAVKGYYNTTSLGYSDKFTDTQSGQQVNGNIDFSNHSLGAQALISKKLLVFTPYLGLGFAKASGELTIAAATAPGATFFVSGRNSAISKPASAQFLGGLDIKLFFLALGAEYQYSFGTSSATGRLSFRF